jgi:hypothetical protein
MGDFTDAPIFAPIFDAPIFTDAPSNLTSVFLPIFDASIVSAPILNASK